MSNSKAEPSRRGTNRFERLCARLFLLLLAIVAALAAAEAASYLVWGKHAQLTAWEFPIEDTRVPKPYVVFGGVQRPEKAGWLNHLGYRGREATPDKPLSEYRIFILGGSTVFFGEPPIAELLEGAFHERGYDQVRVYNFGCVSQMTGAELARVVHEIANLHPDLVLHYSGGNDGWLPFDHDPRPNYPYNFLVHEANPLFDMPGHGQRAMLAVLGESNLVRHVLGMYFIDLVVPRQQLKEEAGSFSDSWRRRIAEIYVSNLVRSQQMARAIGARSVAVLQPHTCYPEVLKQSGIEKVNTHEMMVDHFARVRQFTLQFAERAAADEGLEFHDLSLMFREHEPVIFTDAVHVLQEAHPTIAGRLCDLLAPTIDARVYKPGGPNLAPARERMRFSLWSTDECLGRVVAGKEADAARFELVGSVGRAADLRAARRLLPACAGKRYAIEFRARADEARTVRVAVVPAASWRRDDAQSAEISLGMDWKKVRVEFLAPRDHEDLQIELQLGSHATAVEVVDLAWECLDDARRLVASKCDGQSFSPAVTRAAIAREASWYVMAPHPHEPRVEFPRHRPGTVRAVVEPAQADGALHFVLHRRWKELKKPPGPGGEALFLLRASPAQSVVASAAQWKTPWREGRGDVLERKEIEAAEAFQPVQLLFPTLNGEAVSLGFQLPLVPLSLEVDELRTSAEPAWKIEVATEGTP